MPFEIVRNDITRMNTDAVVNAANSRLQQGGGVCGAIFAAAGAAELQAECNCIGFCDVGSAVITGGYALKARYIIHAVGPVWQGGGHHEEALLKSCYRSALDLALSHDCASVAFPLISSGIFGYPKDKALQTAISAISEFLLSNDMTVYLVVYDKAAFHLGDKLFAAIKTFIDENYIEEHFSAHQNRHYEINEQLSLMRDLKETDDVRTLPAPAAAPGTLDELLSRIEETFSERLLRLIDQSGKTDVEVYKHANIDRKLFSKIRSDPNYKPSKITAIAFAVALELNIDETRDILRKAGFALSSSSKFDLIIQYFIEKGNFDIYQINEVLFAFDQSMLGA
jgi:O-acetyl-ADP-ribose deacetylase (regulator of RNase III)